MSLMLFVGTSASRRLCDSACRLQGAHAHCAVRGVSLERGASWTRRPLRLRLRAEQRARRSRTCGAASCAICTASAWTADCPPSARSCSPRGRSQRLACPQCRGLSVAIPRTDRSLRRALECTYKQITVLVRVYKVHMVAFF